MATADELLKLAERIEAAEGPSRELDGWIHAHMTRGERYIIGSEPGRFPQKPIYGERLDVMRELTNDPEGAALYIGAPDYTASIDSAFTLAERLSETQIWQVWNEALTECSKTEGDMRKDVARFWTAACLRALAKEKQHG